MNKLVAFQLPRCHVCGSTGTFMLDPGKIARWQSGELIQNVWPEKSEDDREMIITGTHQECWDKLFGLPNS